MTCFSSFFNINMSLSLSLHNKRLRRSQLDAFCSQAIANYKLPLIPNFVSIYCKRIIGVYSFVTKKNSGFYLVQGRILGGFGGPRFRPPAPGITKGAPRKKQKGKEQRKKRRKEREKESGVTKRQGAWLCEGAQGKKSPLNRAN